jgi:hypothetical protein
MTTTPERLTSQTPSAASGHPIVAEQIISVTDGCGLERRTDGQRNRAAVQCREARCASMTAEKAVRGLEFGRAMGY